MKNKLLYIILFVSIFANGHAQKKKKAVNNDPDCVLYHDSEINMDLYNGMDTFPKWIDTITSEPGIIKEHFKAPDKKYSDTLRIKFIYLIEKNGAVTFKKITAPLNDKEMENELRRVVGLFPKYKPAMCGNNPAEVKVKIEFPITKKGSFIVNQGNSKN